MVPERGADPRPPDFQSGASTELASQANWSGRRESNPRRTRWQRAILPLNYVRVWWIGHGFEPANPEGTAFTAPLLWPLAYLSELGSGGRNRTDCAFRRELMRLASARCLSPRQVAESRGPDPQCLAASIPLRTGARHSPR